ncbi:Got1/Sft2-like family-domain-containing protein [Blastocladiella britannica]|nr:Got1/Sft2-like family-domain-containing protein [Blastocladiella britannica]
MAESAFKSSFSAFKSSRTAAPVANQPGSAANGGSINPQRWLSQLRGDPTPPPQVEERRGLLSGLVGGSNTNNRAGGTSPANNSISNEGCWSAICICCPQLSTYQRFVAFASCTAGGIVFFVISFFMLPMIVLAPQKFAFLSCIGSLLLFSSIGFLRGWPTHMASVFSKERWPFTLGYMVSLIGGLWASVIIHSYLLTIVFIFFHTVALVYYYVSFLPGGIQGLRAMTGMVVGGGRSLLPI